MSNAGRRIATETGVMLADPELVGNRLPTPPDSWFDPSFWESRTQLKPVQGGRGSAWFVGPSASWVLRHYRRGGCMARIARDRYWWNGEDTVRCFVEWRLLDVLVARGLPVPRPVAARYQRSGLIYRCDLITERLAETHPLSAALRMAAVTEELWRRVGATIEQLHRNGVDHADLNAHNILLHRNACVSVIDFDRGRLRAPGSWPQRNLLRLHRSLLKVTDDLPMGRFSPLQWSWLMAGYEDVN